jgi:hypothetical protein
MTAEHFVTWAEKYYGTYNPVVREDLRTWLAEKQPLFVAGLRIYVRDHFSTKWGKPPDVAICVEYHQKAAQEIWDAGRAVLELGAELQARMGAAK